MVNITHHKKIIVVISIICCMAGGIIFMTMNSEKKSEKMNHDEMNDYQYITVNNQEYKFNTDLKMILFLGIDSQNMDELGQSDMIQLIILNQKQMTMKIISLSRDMMTDIRIFSASGEDLGWKQQHLGLAYSYGKSSNNGCMLAIDAVSRMFGGIPIINYVAINMSSMETIQNVVGSLSIQLSEDYTDLNQQWKSGKTIQLKAKDAEKFLRTRDTDKDYSNTARMKKHKVYIEAYMTQLKKLLKADFQQVIQKLYYLYEDTTTNISLEEISAYAEILMNYQIDFEQSFYTLEGKEQVGKYHDEVFIDQVQLEDLKLKLFYEESKK
ncbi:LCP family protein [Candidatus Stoquefichus massiliensis]|uniref:LCP family protein n=1 Tax=Candidatus Stoquefichus massiliensis TaxID=1470350 RepID=UPI0004826138|nr:LCP family protein [Candidatus Stoquefichus massiliensis]